MSVADDIINGTYKKNKNKVTNSSVAEQILNGTYSSQTKQNQQAIQFPLSKTKTKEQQAQEFFDYLGWNNKKKKKGLFNLNIDTSSGLSSGFDILDPFISLGSSTIDAGANFMSGVENIAVQTTNLLGEGIATVSDLTGNKEFAQNLRDTIGGKNEDYNKKLNDKLLFKKAADAFDDYSIFGETADEIFQGAGYYGGMLGLQSLGVPWQVTAATTSYGSALQKAYENDASSTEANLYALISAAGEVASEYISGGLKLPGTGKTMETFTGRLVDKVGNKGAKAALGFLTNTFGEGAEEVVSGWISSIGEGLTFGSEEDKNALENIWKSSTDYLKTEAGRDFIMGVAVTALTNGVNPQTYQAAREGRNMVTGYTQNEQNIIDSEVEQRIQEAEEKGEKVKRSKILEEVQEDFANGNISLEGLQRGVNGQEYQNYRANEDSIKDINEQIKSIDENIKENYNTKVSKMNPEYQNLLDQKQQLEEQLKPLVANRQDLGNKAFTETINSLQNDSLAQRSIYEYEQGGVNYQYEKTDNMNDNEVGLKDSAAQFGNNTTQFHKFVDGINKVQQSSKTGLKIRFTNTQDIKQKGIAGQITHTVQEGDTIESIAKEYGMTVDEFKELNGNVKLTPGENIKVYGFTEGLFDRDNNILYLNVDSNRALEEILGHELTHTLENTDDYTALRDLLYKQAKKNGIFDKEKARLESIYDGDTDIDSELTAELASKLFTDEKFIEQLGTKPSFRKTVMNFIDDMITAFKGTKEEKQLVALKRQYQKAFSNMNAEVEGEETKLSVKEGEQVAPFNNVQYSISTVIENNEDIRSLEKKKSPYQTLRPNVRGGWNLDKIQKQLKSESSNGVNSKDISEFDSIDDIMENLYYHGSISAHDNLKAGSVLQESQRTGGYGEAYHTISLSGNKNIASNFASMGASGTVMPVILKKNAYVIEMPNIEDSIELEDYLPELWDKGVDAVKIGNWDIETQGYGEQEIVILNPRAIMTLPEGTTYFQNYHKPKFQNMTSEELREALNKRYERALDDPKLTEDRKQDVKNRYNKILNNGNGNVQYSITRDSKGRELSEQQIKYFRDSKARDENGNLIPLYHGSNSEFTIFDITKSGESSKEAKVGFWFTPNKKGAENFANEVWYGDKKPTTYEVYLDIKNPKIYETYEVDQQQRDNMLQDMRNLEQEIRDSSHKYSWTETGDYKVTSLYNDLVEMNRKKITGIQDAEYNEEFYRKLAEGRNISNEKFNEMNQDAINQVELEAQNRKARDDYYTYVYSDAYEQFKTELYLSAGMRAEDANVGGMGMMIKNENEAVANFVEGLKQDGYDGIIIKNTHYDNESLGEGKNNDQYVAFYSNQIKNIDNLNPTTNDDIRYSLSNDIAPTPEDLPFDVTYDEVKEALDLPKNVDRTEYLKVSDTNESTGQEYENQYSPFDKAKKDLAQKKLEKFIEKETYKAIDQATNVAARYGEFNKSQKKQIKADLNRFANMTAEQLTNADTYNEFKDIVSQYADREMDFVDEHLKEVKNDIRKRKFNVSDIKNQITDYADFRRQYFGRLNLTDTGSSIDSQYQELSELYPEYFSPDVTTEADMLNTLAEFMDLDTTITEKYRLSDTEINDIASKAFSTLVREAPTEQQIQEFEDEIDKRLERRRSEVRRQQLLDEMGVTIDDIAAGKDISSLGYQRTDPIRLHEKVFGYEVGNKMNDATIRHTIHNEAELIRWLNQERNEIKELGIKGRGKESAAVQKYGEGEYVNDLGEVVKYGDKELAAEFPNVETQEKIKRASEVLRGKYDRYIDQINEVLTDLGYDAIPKRQNYFRHFMELNDKFSQWGTPFNRQTMQEQDLPTDINGLTDQFKPGKSYFASALERKGIKTTYDAITGIDGYLESAGNLIFHTEDIQRYRALSKLIRETYGQQHGLDNIDIMTEAEKNQRIEDVYGNKLSKYAAWLDEQANALAGKKAGIDRAVERMFGRKVYTAANTLKTQVGSNMTGFNVRSAMTNFASVVQGMSKTNKISLLKGTISTINNMIHDDGMTQKSDFLTGRVGTTQLSQKAWQKIANAGQVFMSATDTFTSNQIWRSKYFENLSKGMTEEQAIRNADDFAARVMGNRVRGATAEIFNSKTLGFLTQFQLEVNNQWSNMVHDNKMDLQSGTKTAASVVFQLGQLAAFSYIFNGLMKGLTGSDVMFDPIDLLKQIFNPDDDDKEKTLEERARGVMGDIVNQLPMASIFTGGRIPIQEAFKGAETGFKYLTNQTNEYGQNYTAGDVFDDSLESLAYLFMPTGYGQLRKTYKGTIDLDYDVNLNPFEGAIGITKRPVRGSYTDTGNLRFTADNSTGGRIKSALFGQYANSEAQDYINSGYKTIPKSKIEELQALEMSSSEYRRWQKDFNDAIATTVEIDGDKYAKYKDDYGNIYFYNKDTRTLLDSDYAESDIDVKTLEKVDKNELIFDYVNNYGFTDEQRQFLYDENFTNTTTDKYGYEKYTGKEVDKKGKTVTKNYYYDPDTDTLYDSKYKEVDSSKLDELTKVAPSKTIQDAEGFDSYEEFDYSYKNPEKYNFIRQTGTYERYKKDKAYKEAVDWSYNTPVNYTMSKAFDENIVAYKEYMDTLNDIKADKDKNGKSISGSRKKKVFNYINSLDLNTEQKAILARSQYSSYDDYGYEIVNYLNNQTNISLEEEYSILEKLGYKIDRNRGTVSW